MTCRTTRYVAQTRFHAPSPCSRDVIVPSALYEGNWLFITNVKGTFIRMSECSRDGIVLSALYAPSALLRLPLNRKRQPTQAVTREGAASAFARPCHIRGLQVSPCSCSLHGSSARSVLGESSTQHRFHPTVGKRVEVRYLRERESVV
jgi:hypothetical protein